MFSKVYTKLKLCLYKKLYKRCTGNAQGCYLKGMKTTILLITHAKTKHFSTLWRLVWIKTEDKVYILNYLFLSLPVTCAGLPSVGQEGVPGGLLLMPPLRPGPSTLTDRRVGRRLVEIWQWREGTRLGMD